MAKTATVTPTHSHSSNLERGINLDVRGTALIEQASERISWHTRNAATFAAELKTIDAATERTADGLHELQQNARRSELTRLVRAHEEHARFLKFVKRHLVARRVYRLNLTDLTYLEIMPRRSYQ